MKVSLLVCVLAMVQSFAVFGSSNSASSSGSGSSAGGAQHEKAYKKLEETKKELRQKTKASKTASVAPSSSSFDHSYTILNQIFKSVVVNERGGQASSVKYGAVDQAALKKAMDSALSLSKKEVDSWSKENQLAYYFNLYNGMTIVKVLEKYPNIKSFKEFGSGFPFFKSPWKVKFFKLFGEESHLDRLEHELVRETGKFNEPRVHFAFNCASIGCPALRDEAFVGSKIESQLEDATVKFLSDKTRNRYHAKKKKLEVSKIFDWYKGDFEQGHKDFHELKDVFAKYAHLFSKDKEVLKKLKEKKISVSFLDYDWNLNSAKK